MMEEKCLKARGAKSFAKSPGQKYGSSGVGEEFSKAGLIGLAQATACGVVVS